MLSDFDVDVILRGLEPATHLHELHYKMRVLRSDPSLPDTLKQAWNGWYEEIVEMATDLGGKGRIEDHSQRIQEIDRLLESARPLSTRHQERCRAYKNGMLRLLELCRELASLHRLDPSPAVSSRLAKSFEIYLDLHPELIEELWSHVREVETFLRDRREATDTDGSSS